MENLQVTKKISIVVYFTVKQWKLFADMEGVKEAARQLNYTLSAVVNHGYDREHTEERVLQSMTKYSTWGANDTESRAFLQEVLDEIYA